MTRSSEIRRRTAETDIHMVLNLDGTGESDIDTGIGFFDHMLRSFARHGFFDLTLSVRGDLEVDCHHAVEDTGIVLGQAIREALKEKKGIRRYGSSLLPMDDALVMCAVDLCGRAFFASDLVFTKEKLGDLDTEMIREFFQALSFNAGMNLHIRQMDGLNNHHIAEAAFKAFARALCEAVSVDSRIDGVLSTKGSLNS